VISIRNSQDCCGCTACKSICPKKAIKMIPDALGFLYPAVNEELCVNCGLCERVCSFNDHYDHSLNFLKPIAYGARHKDLSEIELSRSGAAFIALSDWVLQQGGAVYGAGFTDHFKVVHKRAVTKSERDEFRGSKYVQSELGDVFLQVKEDLRNGMIVLFSGTACQVAGLKSFIGAKLCEKLFLLDIVCHGVPSPYLWKEYLTYVERKKGSRAIKVDFRDKSELGWNSHQEKICLQNGEIFKSYDYTYLFYQNISLRKSCAICYYANTERPSDITLADFWGWEKTDSRMNMDNKGVSLLLVNTPKGENLLNYAKGNLNLYPADMKNVMQPNLQRPTTENPKRDLFEHEFDKKGFVFVAKKYGTLGFKYRLRQFFHVKVNQLRRIKNFLAGKK